MARSITTQYFCLVTTIILVIVGCARTNDPGRHATAVAPKSATQALSAGRCPPNSGNRETHGEVDRIPNYDPCTGGYMFREQLISWEMKGGMEVDVSLFNHSITPGFKISGEASLVVDGAQNATVTWWTGDVDTYVYRGATDSYDPPDGVYERMTCQGDVTYRIRDRKSGVLYVFTRPNGPGAYYLTSEEDHNGNVLSFHLNTQNKIDSITDSNGRRVLVARGAGQRLDQLTDPENKIYRFNYVGSNLASIDLPLVDGQSTQLAFEASVGRLTRFISANGGETRLEYNGDGTLRKIIDATGKVTNIGYSATQTRIDFPEALNWLYIFANESIAEFRSNGVTKATYLWSGHNLSEMTDELGQRWRMSAYDENGNAGQIIDPFGRVTRRTWDLTRNLDVVAEERDYLDRPTRHEYDPAGNLLYTTDPGGRRIVEFTYYPYGMPLTWKDEFQAETSYVRDAYGNVTRTIAPDGREFVEDPDLMGRVRSRTVPYAAGPLTFTYQFDDWGRPNGARYTSSSNGVHSLYSLQYNKDSYVTRWDRDGFPTQNIGRNTCGDSTQWDWDGKCGGSSNYAVCLAQCPVDGGVLADDVDCLQLVDETR